MQAEISLDALNERYERLVVRRSESSALSADHRRQIADKFANKSLQELHEIADRLNEATIL